MVRRVLKRLLTGTSGTVPSAPVPRSTPIPRPVVRPPPPVPEIPSPETAQRLVLFKQDSCGWCRRVYRVVERLGLELEMRDTALDSEAREHHRARTGRSTVPCLYIDDVPLFESADIIVWLEAYAAVEKA